MTKRKQKASEIESVISVAVGVFLPARLLQNKATTLEGDALINIKWIIGSDVAAKTSRETIAAV